MYDDPDLWFAMITVGCIFGGIAWCSAAIFWWTAYTFGIVDLLTQQQTFATFMTSVVFGGISMIVYIVYDSFNKKK